MDRTVTDRRVDARFRHPWLRAVRATVRPGCAVLLIDVSSWGALVQAGRPLRPGARVHLQFSTGSRSMAVAAHVLRCAVWALDPYHGVTYQGALKFEQRCDAIGNHSSLVTDPASLMMQP